MPIEAPDVKFGACVFTPLPSNLKKVILGYTIKKVATRPREVGDCEQVWVA